MQRTHKRSSDLLMFIMEKGIPLQDAIDILAAAKAALNKGKDKRVAVEGPRRQGG